MVDGVYQYCVRKFGIIRKLGAAQRNPTFILSIVTSSQVTRTPLHYTVRGWYERCHEPKTWYY
jgi:hypothetical protein